MKGLTKGGNYDLVLAYVTDHAGCTLAEIMQGTGFEKLVASNAVIFLHKSGRISRTKIVKTGSKRCVFAYTRVADDVLEEKRKAERAAVRLLEERALALSEVTRIAARALALGHSRESIEAAVSAGLD